MKKMILLTVLLLGFACNPFSQVDAAEAGDGYTSGAEVGFYESPSSASTDSQAKKAGTGQTDGAKDRSDAQTTNADQFGFMPRLGTTQAWLCSMAGLLTILIITLLLILKRNGKDKKEGN
ncbi:cell surface complex protein [Lacticaseibacillus paracasei]|uniref:Cell surface complex protein n=1 Tax=Lacticaseibacillus paracasei TaxID=1597 RepID=A0ABD5D1Q3_LACPA|nr:cell surface complex protein [Lacticaseibacillus paracasei]MDR7625673.1 cell surface complex protein [Lacticaseibacillus paracasei]QPC12731.1 cell surface complex protein [Lacticaseibacillus paracasei subsp. tolerans]WMX59826.1 cell surface complex protein [Lacticaseibacillus paracasei]